MKRTISVLFLLTICISAFAELFSANGIWYSTSGTNAVVTSSYNKYSGDIVIPAKVAYNGEIYNVTAIGGSAFKDCVNLHSLIIPNSVTNIYTDAFKGCTGLSEITLSNALTVLGDEIFEGCSSLRTIDIPEGVTTIGEWAFRDCKSLASISLPSTVNKIGQV